MTFVSRYMEKFLGKISKNIDLLQSGGLYAPTVNPYLKRRFISRKRVSLSSLCKFNCFPGMLPQAFSRAISIMSLPKHPLSSQTKLTIWKRAVDLVSDNKYISNTLQNERFQYFEIISKRIYIKMTYILLFFGFSNRNDLAFKSQFLFQSFILTSLETTGLIHLC